MKTFVFWSARYLGVDWVLRNILGRRGLLVLCYHGVVEDDHSEQRFLYRNTVSRQEFSSQLEFVNRHFRPISLRDVLDHLQRGTPIKPGSALVTFDDGYKNNLTKAAPLLLHYGVPALISVTTGYIGTDEVLWADEVNLRVLDWPEGAIPWPAGGSLVSLPEAEEGRVAMANQIRAICKALPEENRQSYLNRLRQVECRRLTHRDRELFDFMSWDDVRSVAAMGFDIASHTVTHPILTEVEPALLEQELKSSKSRIEVETGRRCESLVYPNGQATDFSDRVKEATRRAGYLVAFTMTGHYASLGTDPYALSRIGVPGHQSQTVFQVHASGLPALMRRIVGTA